jgi:hypothetical protein
MNDKLSQAMNHISDRHLSEALIRIMTAGPRPRPTTKHPRSENRSGGVTIIST